MLRTFPTCPYCATMRTPLLLQRLRLPLRVSDLLRTSFDFYTFFPIKSQNGSIGRARATCCNIIYLQRGLEDARTPDSGRQENLEEHRGRQYILVYRSSSFIVDSNGRFFHGSPLATTAAAAASPAETTELFTTTLNVNSIFI